MSTKTKNDDAAGQVEVASEAVNTMPAASSPKAVKGRSLNADKARQGLPDAAPHDGKGLAAFAETAVMDASDPSPNAEEGHGEPADKVFLQVPTSATKSRAGQHSPADKAGLLLPTSATKSRAGRERFADKARLVVPVSASIDALADLGVTRKFWIKSVNRQKNALGALIRLSLGWKPDLPEAEGKKIRERAARIIATGMAGKEQKPEDIEIFKKHENEIAIMGQTILMMEKTRHNAELAMQRIVRKLPVYHWAKEVKGLGELGLAVILAEAGDLSNYPKKGHLWKRLGLAPFEGKAYSTWRMKGGLSAEQWTDAGYSPRRRAEMHGVIAQWLSAAQVLAKEKSAGKHGDPKGPYGEVYVRRMFHTDQTHPEWTQAHKRMDALRVMTKILLRDLWAAWRQARVGMSSKTDAVVPDAETNRRSTVPTVPVKASETMPTGEQNEREASQVLPEEAAMDVPTAHLIAAE